MRLKQKLVLALIAYAVVALVAGQTLSEPRLRAVVWVVLAFFAFRSVLHWYREDAGR
jgi:4-hydroxybenzoate polyprenyltransferase